VTFKIKRTAGQGVEFEINSSGRRPGPFSPFAMPDSLYRMAARRTINALLAENRALRHNKMVVYQPKPRPIHRLLGSVLNALAPKEEDE
jgi:hypothetical protein